MTPTLRVVPSGAVVLLALLWSEVASAQAAASAPPACYPACREGFTCYQGACVSLCNPPCAADQTCVEGRRCEPGGPPPPPLVPIHEPPPPPVKPFDARAHTMIGFHLGFSGKYDVNDVGGTLDSTYGFNIRNDIPIERYLVIGPLLQFGAWRPDVSPAAAHNYAIDVDLYIRARLPIATSSTNFQLWAGMPVGITFDMLGEDSTTLSGFGIGWNIGALVGGAAHFTPNFGLFTEIGWLQHKMTHDSTNGQDAYVHLSQWSFNVGFVFRN